MDDIQDNQRMLEELGISPVEAEIYLALLSGGGRGVAAIAEASGRPRSSVYAALRSLADQGLVEGGAGYGSRYRAAPPEQALAGLLVRERERLARREELIERMRPGLEEITAVEEGFEEEIIEVLRSRQTISERFERLQLEAEHEIDVFVKPPALGTRAGNPAELRALKRGVRNRGLYEREGLDVPEVAPHLSTWVAAGEEARIYPGELPLKGAIFDRQRVLIPLPAPMGRDGVMAVLIRHPSLGLALHILFEHLWEQAYPFDEAATNLVGGVSTRGERRQ